MKRYGALLIVILSAFLLTCCTQKPKEDANQIRLGTISGPETDLVEVAKNVAAQKGLTIKIVQFTDYVLPNQALADGSIDANMFQHQPYLDQTVAAKGYKLSTVGKTFIYPMGLYSNHITRLNDLKSKGIVAIPNDPTNGARALLLLDKAGIIKLKPGVGLKATIQDIAENPRELQFKELDAAQLPRILMDVDLAAINTNYAMVAGLLPSRNALFIEDKDSPYANIVVVRTEDKNDLKYARLMDALHSPEVVSRAKTLFRDQAIPAWQ